MIISSLRLVAPDGTGMDLTRHAPTMIGGDEHDHIYVSIEIPNVHGGLIKTSLLLQPGGSLHFTTLLVPDPAPDDS